MLRQIGRQRAVSSCDSCASLVADIQHFLHEGYYGTLRDTNAATEAALVVGPSQPQHETTRKKGTMLAASPWKPKTLLQVMFCICSVL